MKRICPNDNNIMLINLETKTEYFCPICGYREEL